MSLPTKAKCEWYYKTMLMIRRFEERAGQLYTMGKIAGFCHLYIGQEAVVTGIQGELTPDDSSITTYRDHGHLIAVGSDPKTVMAELTGRATGCSKGKGGSMHMFDVPRKFYGGHGIVGASAALGTGLAFAEKYNKTKNLCVAYFGDGASNQGQVYESFNMAKLWNLPVLYVIENNQYSMGTSVERGCANGDLFNRGEPWGIPGKRVNGMNVLEVAEAARAAIKAIRSGKGPQLLEMKTYRYRGHSMSDPAKYRTKEEVDTYRNEHDPLLAFKRVMREHNLLSEAWFETIEEEIKEQVKAIIEFAEESPEPDASELYTDITLSTQA